MASYEQDRERSFLVSMMNFDLVRGATDINSTMLLDTLTHCTDNLPIVHADD